MATLIVAFDIGEVSNPGRNVWDTPDTPDFYTRELRFKSRKERLGPAKLGQVERVCMVFQIPEGTFGTPALPR